MTVLPPPQMAIASLLSLPAVPKAVQLRRKNTELAVRSSPPCPITTMQHLRLLTTQWGCAWGVPVRRFPPYLHKKDNNSVVLVSITRPQENAWKIGLCSVV